SDEWTEWCLFFLEALCIQIDQNLRVSAQILELYEEMKIRFREVLSSQWLMQALDFMFANPMFRNSRFVKFSGIPKPTARRMTRLLAENDLLRTVIPASGRRPAMYAFEPLLEIVRI
ncbi:MAG: Fic family protein, partial [Paracoccaceae bacterium]